MPTIPMDSPSAQSGPDAARASGSAQDVPGWAQILLGSFLAFLGVLILYLVIAFWPAVQAAATESDENQTIEWFGWSYTPNADAALLVLVILVSALGSYVHATVSFTDYVGNRQLTRSWVWWYLLRLFVGTSLAVLFYFAIRGGFLGAGTDSTDINPYGMAALAGLVGLFSKQATDKLREIFDTAFRVGRGYGDDARGDPITNPAPVLEGSEPQRLRAGAVDVTLVGSGFVPASLVRVAQAAGPELPREVAFLGPQRLRVSLQADDVAAPGLLLVTVFNPGPGGGTSRPLPIWVDEDVEPEPGAPAKTGGEALGP